MSDSIYRVDPQGSILSALSAAPRYSPPPRASHSAWGHGSVGGPPDELVSPPRGGAMFERVGRRDQLAREGILPRTGVELPPVPTLGAGFVRSPPPPLPPTRGVGGSPPRTASAMPPLPSRTAARIEARRQAAVIREARKRPPVAHETSGSGESADNEPSRAGAAAHTTGASDASLASMWRVVMGKGLMRLIDGEWILDATVKALFFSVLHAPSETCAPVRSAAYSVFARIKMTGNAIPADPQTLHFVLKWGTGKGLNCLTIAVSTATLLWTVNQFIDGQGSVVAKRLDRRLRPNVPIALQLTVRGTRVWLLGNELPVFSAFDLSEYSTELTGPLGLGVHRGYVHVSSFEVVAPLVGAALPGDVRMRYDARAECWLGPPITGVVSSPPAGGGGGGSLAFASGAGVGGAGGAGGPGPGPGPAVRTSWYSPLSPGDERSNSGSPGEWSPPPERPARMRARSASRTTKAPEPTSPPRERRAPAYAAASVSPSAAAAAATAAAVAAPPTRSGLRRRVDGAVAPAASAASPPRTGRIGAGPSRASRVSASDGAGRRPYEPTAGEDAELVALIERDILTTHPSVHWADVAGLDDAKRLLEEAVVLPQILPEYFHGIRRPYRGVLLFGPPGTGKTLLAKAVATECETTFFNIASTSLTSKWRGESEKLVRILFAMARHYAPSTIFIDEIDALCASRGDAGQNEASRRVLSELLVALDGVGTASADNAGDPTRSVVVLGATNFPWHLDEALKRRLEKRVYVPLPDAEARRALLALNLRTVVLDAGVDLSALAARMVGYSGADVTSVCRDAAMMSMRRRIRGLSTTAIRALPKAELEAPATAADFEAALANVRPSVGAEDIAKHLEWERKFKST